MLAHIARTLLSDIFIPLRFRMQEYILSDFKPMAIKNDFSYASVNKRNYYGDIIQKDIPIFKDNNDWYFLNDGQKVDNQGKTLERLYYAQQTAKHVEGF